MRKLARLRSRCKVRRFHNEVKNILCKLTLLQKLAILYIVFHHLIVPISPTISSRMRTASAAAAFA